MRKFKAVYAKQYQDNQGQNKTSWKNLGFANEVISDDGKVTIHLTLDSIPTGAWDGEVKLFLQDEQQNNGGGYQQPQNNGYQAPQNNNGGYQQPQQQGYGQPQQPNHTDYQPQGGNGQGKQ